ncbi:hypothetical protein N8466_00335 [Gammaproteobacteria bacterium]|nr:hypothetical protein [Gammaproteobacteria bacterium]
MPYKLLQENISYNFKNIQLLELAFVHKSFDNKHNNERLEFLGDSILNSVIAQYLFLKFPNKKSSKNAIATIENLLTFGCVPIINENDTTSTDEIKFGDNDILAAKISKLVSADHLILLSNIDGLYSEPPKNQKNDILITEVKSITKKIESMAGTASKLGKGGMVSKIKAAEICMKSKCSVIITSGLKKDPIKSLSRTTTKATRFIAKP